VGPGVSFVTIHLKNEKILEKIIFEIINKPENGHIQPIHEEEYSL